jgi:phosphate transport system permease protein
MTEQLESADPMQGIHDPALPDPAAPLEASGNLRRRKVVSRIFEASSTASALVAVAVLGIVVYSVARRGASVLSIDFLTTNPPLFSTTGGGIAFVIVGTIAIVAVAAAIAMPTSILIALYLTEFAGRRSARVIRLVLDLMNGLPTIVIGLFVFELLVVGHHQSGFAGSLALAIVMLPLIARASQEVLLLVPGGLREAADALGVSRWRTVRGVVLPTAMGGILTGAVLAIARAAGETAPLFFASSIFANQTTLDVFGHAVPNIPVFIFNASESADPAGFARAWGAGLVLLLFILAASLGARTLLSRSRAKLTG